MVVVGTLTDENCYSDGATFGELFCPCAVALSISVLFGEVNFPVPERAGNHKAPITTFSRFMKKTLAILLVLSGLIPGRCQGQDSLQVCDRLVCKSSLIPIPVVYYTPETRLAGGGAVLYAFRFRGQAAGQRPSQVQLGAIYTQNKQILFYLPFQFFSNQERFQVLGELGYYKYVYQLYGVGNETPDDSKEFYDADFPRLRVNGLYQFKKNWYAGLQYWWDDYQIPSRDSGGILFENRITGSHGGVISGLGPLLNYDSRNSLFFPTTGAFVETSYYVNNRAFGSDFNFSRLSVDARFYVSQKNEHIWAINTFFVLVQGDPPFQQLAQLGGPKKMRGYFEGRFRDRNIWGLQAEYRVPLIWQMGLALFGGVGNVSPTPGSLFSQKLHITYGAGLRILLAKKDHINLRIDVGGNERGEVFPYLTVGEAF